MGNGESLRPDVGGGGTMIVEKAGRYPRAIKTAPSATGLARSIVKVERDIRSVLEGKPYNAFPRRLNFQAANIRR